MKKYLIGIDFGTLSARALLMDAQSGEELATSEFFYPHGVMDKTLPSGHPLPSKYALQHPQDYLDALKSTVSGVLHQSGVAREDVVALGIDFTTCTVVPMSEDGTPLCMLDGLENEPHAYVKLWKHHGALPYAEEINRIAMERGEAWLDWFGGSVSCEWLLPKIVEVLREAPALYERTARFAEACDWLSYLLTGEHTAGACCTGLKALYSENGFPSNDFYRAIDTRLDGILGTKICTDVRDTGSAVGHLTAQGAALTGLAEGTILTSPVADASASIPALASIDEREMTLIVGTSNVEFILTSEMHRIPGLFSASKGGVLPDRYMLECGQAGAGDMFSWFVHNCVPRAYEEEAERQGMNLHAYLRACASKLKIGENHLIALDWFNGNRSVLKNEALSGMIVGLTLGTRPEEIYRALIEATAFGVRKIIENFEENNVAIDRICVAGGIAQKDPMMMQIYADVLRRERRIAGTAQSAARGCAINAAVAAGLFANIPSAVEHYALPDKAHYHPIPENSEAYDRIYAEYLRLHDYFGKGGNDVMMRL